MLSSSKHGFTAKRTLRQAQGDKWIVMLSSSKHGFTAKRTLRQAQGDKWIVMLSLSKHGLTGSLLHVEDRRRIDACGK